MAWLDDFAEEMNRSLNVFPPLDGLDSYDEILQGVSSVASEENVKCAYWTGTAAESLISDRYKTVASGVVICDIINIPDGSKIVLNSGEQFMAIHSDDVMMQGDLLVVTVRTEDYAIQI